MVSGDDTSEIVFFDVETTIPTRTGQGYALLEFGSITVCSRKLVEIGSYSTLVRPADLSLITPASVRCNGITKEAVATGPSFAEIADRVYDILHGKVWAGHNILRFDCVRIREAFAAINRPAPEPKGAIDSLVLLTQRFGRRAGDMKMATLANYFGLGQQTHRSLDDVRMNLEVLKYCATVLFLESSLPDIFTEKNGVSPSSTSRITVSKASPNGMAVNTNSPSSVKLENHQISSLANGRIDESVGTTSFMTPTRHEDVVNGAQHRSVGPDSFDMGALRGEVEKDIIQPDETMEESGSESPGSEGPSGYAGFLEPDEVSLSSITASLVPFHRGLQRIQILHKDAALQVCCSNLKVRFGLSTKFLDHAGRPRLSFVVDATPNLCRVLDACDDIARKLSIDSGSDSEWRPLVTRKAGFFNTPTIRFHIPTVADGNIARWVTEIYGKDSSGTAATSNPPQRLVFSRFDVAELDALLKPGSQVDVFCALDAYDYQQNAGIRLVAQKLMIPHSN